MMRTNIRRGGGWLIMLVALSCISLRAQTQQALLPFQGQMTDQAGVPLTPTAPLSLAFRLYENPVGGGVLWEEAHPNTATITGRFSVLLGSRAPFPSAIKFSKTLYLGITIDDGDPATADVEMRPRQALVPTIFATNAGNADKLSGHDWRDLLVSGNDPSVGLIRASKIEPKLLENIQSQISRLSQQIENLKKDSPPIGTITSYAGPIDANFEELRGWMLCDGRQLDRNDLKYKALYEAIGSAWGGDNNSKFKLPDLRGLFLRGVDNSPFLPTPMTGLDPGPRRASGNLPTNSVGSIQDDGTKLPVNPFETATDGVHEHSFSLGMGWGEGARDPNRGRADGNSPRYSWGGYVGRGEAHINTLLTWAVMLRRGRRMLMSIGSLNTDD